MTDPAWAVEASYADFWTGFVFGAVVMFLFVWTLAVSRLTARALSSPKARKDEQ